DSSFDTSVHGQRSVEQRNPGADTAMESRARRARVARSSTRLLSARSRGRAAPALGPITLGDERDQPSGELALRALAEMLPAASPIHRERIRFAIETAGRTDEIRRDHVDTLALELLERVLLDVVRLGGEADGERRVRQSSNARERIR